ncbi:hypothetical protein DRE_00439 [Drechslerella stenobrocha 248]|uniref:CipC-like antibiotic response protein n=1 Tax=Drechslerella stenobrocha 248 TaxID=1043628 RepID=W7HTN3_9PEZI|nr:hypothetical protein DRE_00439 [Drechslerella stenobrocha 248]
MTWGDDARNDYEQVHHEGKFSHELLAGAAAFAGIHEFEKRQRQEGKVVNHGLAKELLGSIAAAEAEKLFETKGLDQWDKEKAKHQAKERAERLYDDQYGSQDNYNPNERPAPSYVDHERHHHHHHHED